MSLGLKPPVGSGRYPVPLNHVLVLLEVFSVVNREFCPVSVSDMGNHPGQHLVVGGRDPLPTSTPITEWDMNIITTPNAQSHYSTFSLCHYPPTPLSHPTTSPIRVWCVGGGSPRAPNRLRPPLVFTFHCQYMHDRCEGLLQSQHSARSCPLLQHAL